MFIDEETGTLTVFGVVMIVLMLTIGGIAVDVLNFESTDVQVQNTLDTAVLAAANLNQTQAPATVVSNYFQVAGLTKNLGTISAAKGTGTSTVTANASVTTPTLFMHLAGVSSLSAPETATAKESIGAVEISLVLDNSGSMNQSSKIQNLRIAGQQFVNQMFTSVDPGKLTISVIGYSAQANVGPQVMAALNATNQQTTASCLDFDTADFTTTAMDPGVLSRTSQFDPWDASTSLPSVTGSSEGSHTCPVDTISYRVGLLFSSNQTALDNKINAMQATDYTSIDTGAKWGAMALDPSMQGVVSTLVSNGYAGAAATGRPVAFSDKNTAKVMVVMTDGENTSQAAINAPYITGNSLLWYNATAGSYSLYDSTKGATPYWSSKTSTWLAKPYGQNCGSTTTGSPTTTTTTGTVTTSTSTTTNKTAPASTSTTSATTTTTTTSGTTTTTTSTYTVTTTSYAVSGKKSPYTLTTTVTPVTYKTVTVSTQTCDPGYPNGATQWTWPQVWNVFPVQTFLETIVAKAYGYSTSSSTAADLTMSYTNTSLNTWLNNIESQHTQVEMDANLHNICAAAKAQGITIYTIGFLTTTHGAAVLTDCATAPSYYFNVTSSPNISGAFSAIATNINQLRLTK